MVQVKIKFTEDEFAFCVAIANKRHEDATTRKRGDFMSHSVEPSQVRNLRGIIGEAAVAKATGYKWWAFIRNVPNRKHQKHKDVGPIEVRQNKQRGDMFIKKWEKLDSTPFLLVHRIDDLTHELVGWRFGFEAVKCWAAWLPNPAYRVTPKELYSVASLENWCISSGHLPWEITGLESVEIVNEK